jgi:two-component system sensor histidine kinase DctS
MTLKRDTAAGPSASGKAGSAGRAHPTRSARWSRAALWGALIALLVVAQSLLLVLTLQYESNRRQEAVEATAAAAVAELKQLLARDSQQLQALLWHEPTLARWQREASELVHARRALLRLERRDAAFGLVASVETPYGPPLFSHLPRKDLRIEVELACAAARRLGTPAFSRSYFVPQGHGYGIEVMDLCVPEQTAGSAGGFVSGSFALYALLEEAVSRDVRHAHEVSFVEGDGTRLARSGTARGAGVYVAERLLDLPGIALQLRVDSPVRRPSLIPNLTTALVLGLSLALFGVVLVLARDVRRRNDAETALAEALAFRKAMEDSVITGLRARDLQGRITYVNPAFCAMVGFTADELMSARVPPYWPPEHVEEYMRRQKLRLSGTLASDETREGFETTFMRRTGERFPVVIYEARLVDGEGRHTGWMSAVLDVSAQRRFEELSRQQQERLQATARLATVGEMASHMSHELNQPLAAIASYATGSLNLLDDAPREPSTLEAVRHACQRIAEQADRAGRVIKSVHGFVRRREHAREPVAVDRLLEAVLPLVRLQARKSATRVKVEAPEHACTVLCDRTMVEQVLLNLTRNGIQAMETSTGAHDRELTIRVERAGDRRVRFSVTDRGPGVPADVAGKLFTPFFTTRSEGMGLGLSLCRTVVEQHGGTFEFDNLRGSDGAIEGAVFRFTLPAPAAPSAESLVETAAPAAIAPDA